MERLSKFKSGFFAYLAATAFVAAATVLFYLGRDSLPDASWALLYLLVITFVSALGGVPSGLFAALLSFLAWDYFFLPPYNTLHASDPEDLVALLVFLIVGLLIGLQTGRLRDRQARATAQGRQKALLSRFSANLVKDSPVADMAKTLVNEVVSMTGARSSAVFARNASGDIIEVAHTPDEEAADFVVTGLVQWVCQQSKAIGLPTRPSNAYQDWPISVAHREAGADGARHDIFLPLQTTTRQEGALHVGEKADGTPYKSDEVEILIAIANQASVFLERKHLHNVAVQADARREADRLKSTLLSSISHELKTPITSAMATITNLLEGDVAWDPAKAEQELRAVGEDLNRLNASIGSLLDLSRLESSAWNPKPEPWSLGEILGTVLSRLPAEQRKRISFEIPDELPLIDVDFVQWTRVLHNLLDNALVYSGTDTPVRIGASYLDGKVKMWVEDEGPGVAPEEREWIFARFYRGATSGTARSGTGLGLAITREIVRFHGGEIHVEDAVPTGARFVISLPRREAAAQ